MTLFHGKLSRCCTICALFLVNIIRAIIAHNRQKRKLQQRSLLPHVCSRNVISGGGEEGVMVMACLGFEAYELLKLKFP